MFKIYDSNKIEMEWAINIAEGLHFKIPYGWMIAILFLPQSESI